MPLVVRLGDTGSHGGEVTTSSPDVTAEGLAVARVGDTYLCPLHGPNPITTGSPNVTANGQPVARAGDQTACGAILQATAAATFVN